MKGTITTAYNTTVNWMNELKSGGKLSADSSSYVFTPVRVPPSLFKGFPNPCCNERPSLSSASSREPAWKHGKSEIKGNLTKTTRDRSVEISEDYQRCIKTLHFGNRVGVYLYTEVMVERVQGGRWA